MTVTEKAALVAKLKIATDRLKQRIGSLQRWLGVRPERRTGTDLAAALLNVTEAAAVLARAEALVRQKS